jgi:hypothetical protein
MGTDNTRGGKNNTLTVKDTTYGLATTINI